MPGHDRAQHRHPDPPSAGGGVRVPDGPREPSSLDTSSVSMRQDEPGEWRAGTTFHEVRKMGPRKMEIESRVADLVAVERMDIDSVTGPEFHGHWRLSPDGTGT